LTENQIKEFLHELGADTDSKTAKDFILAESKGEFDDAEIARQTNTSVETVRRTRERLESQSRLSKPFESGNDDSIFMKENDDSSDSLSEHLFEKSKRMIVGADEEVGSSGDDPTLSRKLQNTWIRT
jgi:hypothetical protein